MSEPRNAASALGEIAPGLRHWTIHDERIDFRSEAYAVATPRGAVVVDPLPLAEGAWRALGPVAAVVLTGAFHQRAAWTFRRRSGAPVLAPAGARGLDEAPDGSFGDGDWLAAGLVALDRPGPRSPHFVLRLALGDGRVALFTGDLLIREGDGPFALAGAEHHDDPERTRSSVRRLVAEPADVLCPAHGAPAAGRVAALLRAALGDEG